MRILLVEDNRALAEGLSTLLRGSGYAVDVVSDGASAHAVAAAESFDLVILDLNLPEMDGLDVLRAMRARQNRAAVLILTARGTPEERIKGLDLGADDYLIKPFDIGEFEARVRVLLRRQAGCAPPSSAMAMSRWISPRAVSPRQACRSKFRRASSVFSSFCSCAPVRSSPRTPSCNR